MSQSYPNIAATLDLVLGKAKIEADQEGISQIIAKINKPQVEAG